MMRNRARFSPYIEAPDAASLPTSLSSKHVARVDSNGDYYVGDGAGGWNLFREYARNWLSCATGVAEGDPVYWDQATGSFGETGQITPTGTIRTASADHASEAGVVGIVLEKHDTDPTLCRIASNGSYAGVAGPLATGQPYYLGEGTGNIVATPPSELGWVQIGVARTSTEIDIFIHPYGILPQ